MSFRSLHNILHENDMLNPYAAKRPVMGSSMTNPTLRSCDSSCSLMKSLGSLTALIVVFNLIPPWSLKLMGHLPPLMLFRKPSQRFTQAFVKESAYECFESEVLLPALRDLREAGEALVLLRRLQLPKSGRIVGIEAVVITMLFSAAIQQTKTTRPQIGSSPWSSW